MFDATFVRTMSKVRENMLAENIPSEQINSVLEKCFKDEHNYLMKEYENKLYFDGKRELDDLLIPDDHDDDDDDGEWPLAASPVNIDNLKKAYEQDLAERLESSDIQVNLVVKGTMISTNTVATLASILSYDEIIAKYPMLKAIDIDACKWIHS